MTHYPILFGYKDLIAGDGFTAGVAIDGRALIVEDDDGFWMYGVTPGGICADGDSQKEAAAEFRSVYRQVLYDIAAEAPTFDAFSSAVEAFFADEDEVLSKDWTEAVAAVRQGEVGSDWLEKQPADSPRGVRVIQLTDSDDDEVPDPPMRRPQPSFNALDELARAAA